MTDTISSFHTNYTEKILEDRKIEDKQVSQSIQSLKSLRGKQENNSDDPGEQNVFPGKKESFAKIFYQSIFFHL